MVAQHRPFLTTKWELRYLHFLGIGSLIFSIKTFTYRFIVYDIVLLYLYINLYFVYFAALITIVYIEKPSLTFKIVLLLQKIK